MGYFFISSFYDKIVLRGDIVNIVELSKHKEVRKKISLYTSLVFSVPTAILLFLLSLGGGFIAALLFSVLIGGSLFGFIYFIREVTHRGVERRRQKLDISNTCIDVLYNKEIGVLEFTDDKLIYHTLTPGAANKDFEIMISDKLYMSAGTVKYSRLQSYTHKDIESGFILIKLMPNGLPYQFIFYNIDDSVSKVLELVNRLSKYVHEE